MPDHGLPHGQMAGGPHRFRDRELQPLDHSRNVPGQLLIAEARRVDAAAKLHPGAKRYEDFRKVFDDAKDFDAVVVAIPEHTHAFATLPALQLGKHVYCEKPLTHGVWEARVIQEAAKKATAQKEIRQELSARRRR